MARPHLIHDADDGTTTERDLHGRIIVTMPHAFILDRDWAGELAEAIRIFVATGRVVNARDETIGTPVGIWVYRGRTVAVFIPLAAFDEGEVRDPAQHWEILWGRDWDETNGHTNHLRRFGLVATTPAKVISLPIEETEEEEVAV